MEHKAENNEMKQLQARLRTEQQRRQEVEQELLLTKQQLARYTRIEMETFAERRRLVLAKYKLEYELKHENDTAEAEDEID